MLALLDDGVVSAQRLSLRQRERPDFELAADSQTAGIEVTRAISPNLANAYRNSDGMIGPSHPELRPGARPQRWAELKSTLGGIGPGWDGDEVERDWLYGIGERVADKRGKTWDGNFHRRWLFIYEDLGGIGVDHDELVEPLSRIDRGDFDRVAILSGDRVVDHSSDGVRLLRAPVIEMNDYPADEDADG